MKIRINFKSSVRPISYPMNKQINGFINMVLGENNKYHGKVSSHSVSLMNGRGIYDRVNRTVEFPDGGYIYVSSPDSEFMLDLIVGLGNIGNADICGMELKGIDEGRYDVCNFYPNKKYDYVTTMTPIILTDDRKNITYEHEKFLDVLTDKCIKKLIHYGISEEHASTIRINLCKHDSNRTFDMLISGQHNICSRVTLKVYGDESARVALYEMGLGKSTSFCFGTVKINDYIRSERYIKH